MNKCHCGKPAKWLLLGRGYYQRHDAPDVRWACCDRHIPEAYDGVLAQLPATDYPSITIARDEGPKS